MLPYQKWRKKSRNVYNEDIYILPGVSILYFCGVFQLGKKLPGLWKMEENYQVYAHFVAILSVST